MGHFRIAIATVGCRANQADSAALLRGLDSRQVEVIKGFDDADAVIINTCCVTAEAERDCRKLARRALGARDDVRVILAGCAVSAVDGFGLGIDPRIERYGGNDAHPSRLAARINALAGGRDDVPVECGISPALLGRTRALVKIQTGCSHSCAYCIVPRARGPESSITREKALEEVRRLAKEGYKEVVLTGVQLGAWGSDLPERPRLADLLIELADSVAPGRIRLSSIEPWSVREPLIEAMGGHKRFCHHLHLPLQSGDDRVLRAMGRGYSAKEFLSIVRRVRDRIPGVAIGTDVLLGFPGEDDQAFKNTMQVLDEIDPAYLHAFTYSPRPGTRAADLPDRPPREKAKERTRAVRDFGKKSTSRYRAGQIGNVREIIIEERRTEGLTGLTDNFVPVVIIAGKAEPGDLIKARLEPAAPGKNRLGAVIV
ncbi:MAG: MiaB/RimO family radical SAM methylthiotransferase [Deltaproteobacteria bacterium]|nr:MiaB/RimO family radical SAM methylthiotransferase [Deltaproteobacteria bacterium]